MGPVALIPQVLCQVAEATAWTPPAGGTPSLGRSAYEAVQAAATRSVPPDPDRDQVLQVWLALREAYLLAEREAAWDEDRREEAGAREAAAAGAGVAAGALDRAELAEMMQVCGVRTTRGEIVCRYMQVYGADTEAEQAA